MRVFLFFCYLDFFLFMFWSQRTESQQDGQRPGKRSRSWGSFPAASLTKGEKSWNEAGGSSNHTGDTGWNQWFKVTRVDLPGGLVVKNPPANTGTRIRPLFWGYFTGHRPMKSVCHTTEVRLYSLVLCNKRKSTCSIEGPGQPKMNK